MRFWTPLAPSTVITEKFSPLSGQQLPSASYFLRRYSRYPTRTLGSLRILLISLRIMEAMLVYEMLFGMGIRLYLYYYLVINKKRAIQLQDILQQSLQLFSSFFLIFIADRRIGKTYSIQYTGNNVEQCRREYCRVRLELYITYEYTARSAALEDPQDCLLDVPPSTNVVGLLLALHPLRGQNHKDGVLVQEVADQNAAYFIVVPLFLLRPVLAPGLVELSHKPQTFLVSVMSELVLEQTLIEVVTLQAEFGGMGELVEELLGDETRFALLLEEAEDLVDLVGNDVSVLVLLIFGGHLSLSLCLRVVFPILLHHHFPSLSFHLLPSDFFIGNGVSDLEGFALVREGGRLPVVRKDDWSVWLGLIAVLEKTVNVGLIFGLTHLAILLKIAGGFSHALLAVPAGVSHLHSRGKVVGSRYLRLS